MAEGAQNHYQVLGIERTADERAIKKAYFTLIRKFPPDSHPEQFQAIRAAYEVLSDPVARQRFDNAEKDFGEYGDEVGQRLKEIEELKSGGDEEQMQRRLKELLAEHPDLVIAREYLGYSYLRVNAFPQALETFRALSDQKPEEAKYHLYRGIALRRLDKGEEAIKAVKEAHARKPEDFVIHVTLIDFYRGMNRFAEALKEIDLAMDQQAPESEQALVLTIRKADAYLSVGMTEEVDEVMGELKALIAALKDPELPKYVSSQIASVAARLFARDERTRANDALRRCEEIHPDSVTDHPYPEMVELDVDALPQEGIDWLTRQAAGKNSPTVAEATWPLPILSLIGAVIAPGILFNVAFEDPAPWDTGTAILIGALIVGMAIWIGASLRAVVRILRSPLRSFITVHPLYLLRVRGALIQVYPLFGLTNVRVVHHHTNGVYTHTLATITFGTKAVTVSLRGKDFAQGWVELVTGSRDRALELMLAGYLEAQQGLELIPPALLTKVERKQAAKGDRLRWIGRAGAAGVAAALITALLHARAADGQAYRMAVQGGTTASYSAYLAAHPSGRFAEEAKHQRARLADRAAEELRAAALADAPGLKGILAALDAVTEAGVNELPVTVVTDVNAGGNPDLGDPGGALGHDRLRGDAAALVDRLDTTLANAGLAGVMHLKLAPDAASAPVSMAIHAKVIPDGGVLRAEGITVIPTIKVAWEVSLTRGGAGEPIYRFSTTVDPEAEISLIRPPTLATGRFARAALDAQVDRAFDVFAERLVKEIGLPAAAPLPPRGGLTLSGGSSGKDGAGR